MNTIGYIAIGLLIFYAGWKVGAADALARDRAKRIKRRVHQEEAEHRYLARARQMRAEYEAK